jgi:hypothetical protein
MFSLFFIDPESAKGGSCSKDHIREHVSKDLGIPYWQIGPEQVQLWIDKGFKPFNYEEWRKDWWKEPAEEDKKRWMKMSMGSALRKDIWPPGTEPKKQAAKTKRN